MTFDDDGVWDVLGIAPTSDTSAIRRAYARRLKAIDVDRDPPAFMALREARDIALDEAAAGLHDGTTPDDLANAPAASGPAEEVAPAGRPAESAAAERAPDTVDHHLPAIERLLLAGEAGDAIEAAFIRHFEAMLADPRLDEIAFYDAVERRVAELLAHTIPRSDPVLEPVADRLGWMDRADQVGQLPVIAFLTDRVKELRLQAIAVDAGPSSPPLSPERASLEAPVVPPDPEQDDVERDLQAIWSLLFPADPDRPRPTLGADVERHFHAICADPRMAEIAFYSRIEQWFAEVLARSCPMSDPVIEPIATHFGWMDHADEVGQQPTIAFVTDRVKLIRFFDAVREKGHPLHSAWRELTKPASENSRRGMVGRKKVRELLSIIRTRYPALEQNLDWYRVQLWDSPAPAQTGVPWFLIVFGIISLIRVLASVNHDSGRPADYASQPPPAIRDVLVDARADLDVALKSLSQDSVGAAEAERHPAFYAELRNLWARDKADGKNRWDLTADLGDYLDARFDRVVDRAGYDDLVALARLRLAQAKEARDAGWEMCDDFFRGKNSNTPNSVLYRQQRRVIFFRILLSTADDKTAAPRERSFSISGETVDDAVRRAGMSRASFEQAIMDRGTPQARCTARIALYETALALPRDAGADLLPKL